MSTPLARLAPPLISAYFVALGAGLWLVAWDRLSAPLALLTAYAALFLADLLSGLVHLYIDYRPLNREKGYDWLFGYRGDRRSDDFLQRKRAVVENSSLFDLTVYQFKIHHRSARSNRQRPYAYFFYETVVPAGIMLALSIALSTVFDHGAETAYLSLGLLVMSVAGLHTEHVHAWVHGSETMPRGVAFVRRLQRLRLVYDMNTHGRHHRDGDSGFCFITGHANFLVDRLCRLLLRQGVIHRRDWLGESHAAP